MKRFLTQALVDHWSVAKARIRHHGDWHRLVWQAFRPIEGDDIPRTWLYAVEETPEGCKVLILSEAVPTRPDWCPAEGWTTKALPDNFLEHSRYVFRLTACATRILSADGGKKRISLAKRTGPEDNPELRLLDWLERKGAIGGFRILRQKTLVGPMEAQAFPTSDKSHHVTLQYTRFQGILDVTDSSIFSQTFNSGIGRAKSYGAGMLLLKPIL